MHVLIVPDKLKGTLTAQEAARAIAHGWSKTRPGDTLTLLPMSDGGEGFGPVMSRLLGAQAQWTGTVDAAGRTRRARWWWHPSHRLALIESAESVGLALLLPGRCHPFDLDSSGLGGLLNAVAKRTPRRTLIGLGGSATNDGGFGLARAIGWRFLDQSNQEITHWPRLTECRRLIAPRRRARLGRVTVATDVLNPLLGPTGCTRTFGPQKGLHGQQVRKAEAALRQLATVVECELGESVADSAGAGAAGGLGFGLMSFLNAKPAMGFTVFASHAGLERQIRSADLVITAEGRLDAQSLMGKGPGELLRLCQRLGTPCVALAGRVQLAKSAAQGFIQTQAMTTLTSHGNAVRQPAHWLAKAAETVAIRISRRCR